MKKLLVLALFTLAAVIAVPQINAETTGDVTGSFTSTGYNNDAVVDYDFLTISRVEWDSVEDTESGVVTTALTPQLDYFVDFDVDDLDGFTDLVVEFQFFQHIVAEGTTIEEDFDSHSASDIESFVVLWDSTNGFTSTVTGTSWMLNPDQPGEEDPVTYYASSATGTDTSKTFKIYFSPSKVAPASASGEWVAAVKVYDYIGVTDWVHGTSTPTDTVFESVSDYTMDWYGEVTHGVDTIAWTSATPGMDYGDAGSTQTYNGMTFISNSNYYQQVKASEIWEQQAGAAVSGDATLKASPTTSNSFAIQAKTLGEWYNASDVQQDPDTPSSATQVTHVDYTTIGGTAYYERTSESGALGKIQLELSLNTNFQNGDYQGTITFAITNVVEPV